jgi:BirA family biotin operon repressor/biotin-[acetyl-CoA-carboxylase] ligase
MEQIKQAVSRVGMPALHFFPSIGSTNDEALAWAEAGAADYSLVVADQQTAGRGRLNRGWVTNPGAALAFSLVLHPSTDELEKLARFSPLAALAICAALEDLYGLAAQIKYPNDVLLNGRKTAGILVETAWNGSRPGALVIGAGINVAPESVPPAAEVSFPATCVESELGRPVDRWELLRAVLEKLVSWRERLASPEFMAAWRARLAFRGEPVSITATAGQDRTGRLLDVDDDGRLVLEDLDGKTFRVDIGDVHLRNL